MPDLVSLYFVHTLSPPRKCLYKRSCEIEIKLFNSLHIVDEVVIDTNINPKTIVMIPLYWIPCHRTEISIYRFNLPWLTTFSGFMYTFEVRQGKIKWKNCLSCCFLKWNRFTNIESVKGPNNTSKDNINLQVCSISF